MIAPLRRRHATLLPSLALVATAVLAFAVGSRSSTPSVSPDAERSPSGRELTTSWEGPTIRTRLSSEGELWLQSEETLSAPDLLLYWLPEAPSDALPVDARLLGPWNGSGQDAFDLPSEALERSGHLLLFSLGHGELVTSTAFDPREGV